MIDNVIFTVATAYHSKFFDAPYKLECTLIK